jgi:hypothetical protein
MKFISDPISVFLVCSDLANLSRYEAPNDLPKLVSGIERSQFQSKLDDSEAKITKKDVFDLITTFADSSTPTFTIPSNDSCPRQKSLMVANAFDITGPVPDYDLLFSKGIFVRVDIPPHQLLQIYKLKNEEPKTTGKKKGRRHIQADNMQHLADDISHRQRLHQLQMQPRYSRK